MGGPVGGDYLTDEDRDENFWSQSDKECEGCGDNISYGDECVVLSLVYPAPYNGTITLLDALEDDGSSTAEPVLFCFSCWDEYTDCLRAKLKDLFVNMKGSAKPSPLKCAYCQKKLNWGEYCGYAKYGQLDVSPRTRETTFVPSPYEVIEHAELICLDCLASINEEQAETIWEHLWLPDDALDPSTGL